MKIEIQKVPVHQEPEKPEATDGQQSVPNLVPNPLRGIAPGFNSTNDGKEGADSAEDADDLKQVQFKIAT